MGHQVLSTEIGVLTSWNGMAEMLLKTQEWACRMEDRVRNEEPFHEIGNLAMMKNRTMCEESWGDDNALISRSVLLWIGRDRLYCVARNSGIRRSKGIFSLQINKINHSIIDYQKKNNKFKFHIIKTSFLEFLKHSSKFLFI